MRCPSSAQYTLGRPFTANFPQHPICEIRGSARAPRHASASAAYACKRRARQRCPPRKIRVVYMMTPERFASSRRLVKRRSNAPSDSPCERMNPHIAIVVYSPVYTPSATQRKAREGRCQPSGMLEGQIVRCDSLAEHPQRPWRPASPLEHRSPKRASFPPARTQPAAKATCGAHPIHGRCSAGPRPYPWHESGG